MKYIKILPIMGILLQLFSCNSVDTPKKDSAIDMNSISLNEAQIQNAGIVLGNASTELMGHTIYANGTIEVPPQNKTVISAQFGGFVKSLNVLDGMSVKKGQTLLTIEHPDLIQLQQDYLEVLSNLEYLKAEVERQQKLASSEASTLKLLQQAKAEYNAAMARRSGLRAKLQMAGVDTEQLNSGEIQKTVALRAPFSGVVTKVSVEVGAFAQPTDHLLELIDLQHSHAEVIVFEKEVKLLKIGQKVTLNFAGEEQAVEASIFLVGKEIAKDRTVKIHCHMERENASYPPGSYFKASIYTGEKEYLCLPSESITELNGKKVVFCVKAKKGKITEFIPQEVHVLSTDGEKSAVEFVGGQNSQTIVLKGAYDIMSALLIKGEE
jgi:cobalt-zinc-cadmium efflux system membrane fusion protein